jgi:hypothetical protein
VYFELVKAVVKGLLFARVAGKTRQQVLIFALYNKTASSRSNLSIMTQPHLNFSLLVAARDGAEIRVETGPLYRNGC